MTMPFTCQVDPQNNENRQGTPEEAFQKSAATSSPGELPSTSDPLGILRTARHSDSNGGWPRGKTLPCTRSYRCACSSNQKIVCANRAGQKGSSRIAVECASKRLAHPSREGKRAANRTGALDVHAFLVPGSPDRSRLRRWTACHYAKPQPHRCPCPTPQS